jgi:hypothetical protein
MRDLTKSMMSYGWAMSVFGLQQAVNLMMPQQGGDPAGKAARAFDDVTQATVENLEGPLKTAFNAGDKMQGGMIDSMFGGFMGAGLDPSRWMRMGNELLQQMGDCGRRAAQSATGASGNTGSGPGAPPAQGGPAPASSASGWGPMPH